MKRNLRSLFYLLFFSLFFQHVVAQIPEWNDPNSLPIWMTPEEEGRRHEIGKNFLKSAALTGEVRNVAEFERMEGVLVRYPLGLPTSFIAAMSKHTVVYTLVSSTTYENSARSAYQSAGATMTNCKFIRAATDSYWTRDYGPWYVMNESNQMCIVDFPYDRPRANDDAVNGIVGTYLNIPVYNMPVVHTGGNYMTDGWGISASTDLVYEENSNNVAWVNQQMNAYLGVDTYHVTIDPLGDYIKHIDCWGKFLDVDKVLITQVPTTNANYSKYEQVVSYFASQTSAYGTPYQVFRVYSPSGQPYTNSLIVNDRVYVPIKSSPASSTDNAALEVYRQAMPGYTVTGIYYSSWQSTDALHCRAMGMADRQMLYIKHQPLTGVKPYQSEYGITAEILPLSGQMLKSDSLFLIYQTNARSWDTLQLVNTGGTQYGAMLPVNPGETQVSYYLYAVDNAGKRENHPLIGRPDPHIFNVIMPSVFVDFSASATSATIGENITFTDQSTGSSLTSWIWNFGEGAVPATAEGRGPHNVVYSQGGMKTVVLTVNGEYTKTKTDFIEINDYAIYSASATFSGGDLPTDSYFTDVTSSSSCPGVLSVYIPSGAIITGVDVSYSMTAQYYGYMADQRSQLRCTSSGGLAEPVLVVGAGNAPGTYTYLRKNLDIANGVKGGGEIRFELHTGRTWSYSGYSGCQTYNNKVDDNTWKVTVHYTFSQVPVSGIIVTPEEAFIVKNEQIKLFVSVFPDNATDQSVVYESSNPLVAQVGGDGTITAIGNGECLITALSNDGGFIANCRVTVVVPVTGIVVTPETVNVQVGEEVQLIATILPEDATDQRVNWTCSDPSVAYVTTDGKVIAKGAGVAVISATDHEGNYTAECIVDVPHICTASGFITFEKWTEIRGTAVSDLTNSTNYPDHPTITGTLDNFVIPSNSGDYYGCRVSGFLCAPETGYYRFWITGDGNVELWLSSDDTESLKTKIAYHNSATKPSQWNKYSTQRSYYVYLEKANSYYIEALMKEGTGSDNLAVGWLKPGQSGIVPSEIIPGSVLSPRFGNAPVDNIFSMSNELKDIGLQRSIEFSVYPNPTKGLIRIVPSETLVSNVLISVLSMTGQVVLNKNMDGINQFTLDLGHLRANFYIIKIQYGEQIFLKKILRTP